ncbi:hypothetical protein SUGI_1228430 [Cryptomeria japonica]|uniref:Uncharacterized protein n=1 Tax=Cryptomeria japonica TaxID=3369 RepID=A0AAD3RMI2_CRYJA|nr:hypothetical protein SUGI_1228430 [Cryptomeria japonica]
MVDAYPVDGPVSDSPVVKSVVRKQEAPCRSHVSGPNFIRCGFNGIGQDYRHWSSPIPLPMQGALQPNILMRRGPLQFYGRERSRKIGTDEPMGALHPNREENSGSVDA